MENEQKTVTRKKLQKMKDFIRRFRKVIVAFSGGVDSSTLAAICKDVLGENVLAITLVSQKSPSREIADATRIAKEIGVEHEFLEIDILTPEFRKNTPERCYFCKKNILSAIIEIAEKRGYDAVFEGTNASDLKGHRPGYRAVLEFKNVYSPWAEFGITKDEIRLIARSMGFSFYNKPSLACLASRIPFGTEIDENKLKMVDKAENAVIEIAEIEQVRVRNFDGKAVIEVESNELPKILNEDIIKRLRERLQMIGFSSVLLDLEGYRTGKISF